MEKTHPTFFANTPFSMLAAIPPEKELAIVS
jgi:hypothetical protein